jgi:hypothetical protein
MWYYPSALLEKYPKREQRRRKPIVEQKRKNTYDIMKGRKSRHRREHAKVIYNNS